MRVCNRLQQNLPVGDLMMKSSSLRKKYLRIRFEDFVVNPIRVTEEIYKFVGLSMTNQVKEWLSKAISEKNPKGLSRSQRFSITRNSKDVLVAWRKELSFEKTLLIQEICYDVLTKLNYKIYDNKDDYNNTNNLHFVPSGEIKK